MAAGKMESWAKLPYAVHRKGLGPWARLVYAVLLDKARGETTVRMGCRRLAKILEADKDTVGRAIEELEQWKLLEVIRGANGASNSYKLVFEERQTVPTTGTVPRTGPSPGRGHRPSPPRGHPVPSMGTVPSPAWGHKISDQTLLREDRPADKPPRARCEVWDTLCELFEDVVDPVADAKRIGKVRKALLAKGATAAEMKIRAARYKATWPDMEFTPEALNKHWKRFEDENSGRTANRPGRVKAPAGKYDNLKLFGDA
jgi:hypothetical protein